MRLAILAVFCVAAVTAQLSPEQQSRLEELLKNQDNAELAALLAAADEEAAASALAEEHANIDDVFDEQRNLPVKITTTDSGINTHVKPGQDVAFTRLRKESADIFAVEAELKDLQDRFDKSIGSDVLAGAISTAVTDTMNKDALLLGLIKEQGELKKALADGLDASASAFSDGVKKFFDDAKVLVDAASKAVAEEADARKKGEAALDKKLDDFKKTTEEQLKVVDGLEKAVGDQIEKALKPLSGSISMLDRLKLTFRSDPKIPVFRWNWWHTHQHGSTSWYDSNNPRAFGGVHPSHWTDGNRRAWDMNKDLKYIKRFFIRHGTGDKWGATVCSETFLMYSSTTGRMCGVLFRIKNTKSSSVGWNPQWMYTSFGGWSEDASVSLNGGSNFRNHCNHNFCRNNVNMNIPASGSKDRISTVIFTSSGCHNYHVGYNRWERANIMMFNDNSLTLPDGLEYVDDLDTASGSWKN